MGHLGSVLWRLGRILEVSAKKQSENIDFTIEKSTLEPSNIKPPLQRECDLRDCEIFETNIQFGGIWLPTWLHFGSIFQIQGRLGGILSRLGGVLGRLGALWGASRHVLARLQGPEKLPGRPRWALGSALGSASANMSPAEPSGPVRLGVQFLK